MKRLYAKYIVLVVVLQEQMPHWQKLYSDYKNKGFNVIAISSDKMTFMDNWKAY